MSKIPVKPFQPLPPLVRMERMRDAPHGQNGTTTSPPHDSIRHDTDPWLIDSPTNRSVALLVTNSSGISQDATLPTSTSPNDGSNDLWNPLMMMVMMMDEDDDDDHVAEDRIDRLGPHDGTSLHPASATTTAKRVSLDVSDACAIMMDVDATSPPPPHHHHHRHHSYHESLLHPDQDLTMMTSTEDQHDHEFEFMEDLEDDPLLTLSVTCAGNDIVGTSGMSHSRISDSLHLSASVPQRLPSLRRLLSAHNNDYDVDHDDMNDPWTEAVNEAAFQMTTSTTALDNDHNDMMVFEIDQSFLKANGHTTTVGTESTVSSYSSVSPDLLSVFTGDNNHHHINHTTTGSTPTFFTSKQFQERCQLLSESMRASQLSRQCLSLQENIKLRANLAKVLKDIERSTAKVQRHCLSQQIPLPPSSNEPPSTTTTTTTTTPDHGTTDTAAYHEINNDLSFAQQLENDVVDVDTTVTDNTNNGRTLADPATTATRPQPGTHNHE